MALTYLRIWQDPHRCATPTSWKGAPRGTGLLRRLLGAHGSPVHAGQRSSSQGGDGHFLWNDLTCICSAVVRIPGRPVVELIESVVQLKQRGKVMTATLLDLLLWIIITELLRACGTASQSAQHRGPPSAPLLRKRGCWRYWIDGSAASQKWTPPSRWVKNSVITTDHVARVQCISRHSYLFSTYQPVVHPPHLSAATLDAAKRDLKSFAVKSSSGRGKMISSCPWWQILLDTPGGVLVATPAVLVQALIPGHVRVSKEGRTSSQFQTSLIVQQEQCQLVNLAIFSRACAYVSPCPVIIPVIQPGHSFYRCTKLASLSLTRRTIARGSIPTRSWSRSSGAALRWRLTPLLRPRNPQWLLQDRWLPSWWGRERSTGKRKAPRPIPPQSLQAAIATPHPPGAPMSVPNSWASPPHPCRWGDLVTTRPRRPFFSI